MLTLFAVLSFLLLVVRFVGMWRSHGGLRALLAGQRPAEPRDLRRAVARASLAPPGGVVEISVDLGRPAGLVSERYLSVAIDVAQVVGGIWWNPRATGVEWGSGTVPAPVLDLSRPRLARLAGALAPAYLRIGGSEADKTYYDLQARSGSPPGHASILTRAQWDAACDFARRTGLDMVFTLNAGPGSRDAAGRWRGGNAAELLAYTAARGVRVAAWELGNELNAFFSVHGLRHRVPVAQYGRDLRLARALIDRHSPGALLATQGSLYWPVLGEPLGLFFGYLPAMLRRAGSAIDVVTWHYYPQQSRRAPAASRRAGPSRLLDPTNLDEVAHWAGRILAWRDRYAPGKPLWLGETGSAEYGGEPGVSDAFVASLWWLDQLGLLARHGHAVVVRQTLTGSDYGLLDEERLEPRPDYWASLLWKRCMGRQVYRARANGPGAERLRVYAHDTPGGGVTLLAINLDPHRPLALAWPQLAGRPYLAWRVTAPDVLGSEVWLGSTPLHPAADGTPPALDGQPWPPGDEPVALLPPVSYAFFSFGSRAQEPV